MDPSRVIDLRSDTVTLPTPGMREAMFTAQVGDDVYGEDPTINRLEAMAAERMGKEAALFVASGTMANLVCLLTHCRRGEEAIMGHLAHTFLYEAGGCAAVGGIHPRTVANRADGTMSLDELEDAIRDPNECDYPISRLICLENTQNRCSGAVLSQAYMGQVRALADRYGLAVHLDGARVWNAAAALGVSPEDLTQHADSVSFCLSKGLAAPVGSLVCGTTRFIREARRNRTLLGGGMRQAGVLAAAGIVALETMVDRLVEDHANARRMAEGLAALPGVIIDAKQICTNIVIFGLVPTAISAHQLAARLDAQGVKLSAIAAHTLRAVTHYGIEPEDIDSTLAAAKDILGAGR